MQVSERPPSLRTDRSSVRVRTPSATAAFSSATNKQLLISLAIRHRNSEPEHSVTGEHDLSGIALREMIVPDFVT